MILIAELTSPYGLGTAKKVDQCVVVDAKSVEKLKEG
jgi:hypothetical protein